MILSDEINDSLTLQFAISAAEMRKTGKQIYSLGLGEPDFEIPEYVIRATEEAMQSGYHHYSASQGLPELRESIVDELSHWDNNHVFHPNQVIVTPGVKQAIFIALAAILRPFDEVVNISPYYVSYPAIIKLAEPTATIRNVSLLRSDFSLDYEAMENNVTDKTKVIVLNSPHNPTGMIFNQQEMKFLINLAERHDAYILSDEVYDKIVFPGQAYTSFAAYPSIRSRLILVNGYSKSYGLTGWRIGYIVAAEEEIKIMNRIQQQLNTNTCTFVQKGVCSIYQNACTHLKPYLENLKERVDVFDDFVRETHMFSGVRPKGGFFYFLNTSSFKISSNDFCSRLIKETGVATTPGLAFGRDWDDHVRFSLAVNKEVLLQAIDLMKVFFTNSSTV